MFSIGEISRRTGVKVATIRYYEGMGLIVPQARTEGNQRRYDRAGLKRLGFIRHARDLGLPLETIRELAALEDRDPAAHDEIHAIAHDHLKGIRDRIKRLRRLEAELQRIADACDAREGAPCHILHAFGDHDQCGGAH